MSFRHAASSEDTDASSVQAVAIDETSARLGVSRVDFIKMDIEGAERHALAGARTVLGRDKPKMAVCLYHLPDDPEVIPRVVREAQPAYRWVPSATGEVGFFS